ncbi:hypothetical protein COM99_21275 [Bacillus cereus]|uniref:hypothetical protein n=1 Tax=Bacillus cereus TaxID=1396 RepID=UPI000BEB54D0|nr:hypothetical protein [Bacillus cereus]PEC31785.1 hypothetical protein COM99_21275 [Bacillus cereus]
MRLVQVSEISQEIINNFSCTQNEYTNPALLEQHEKIDRFFREKAYIYHQQNIVRTHVLLDTDNRIIGFFSLFNEEIRFTGSQKKSLRYKQQMKLFEDEERVSDLIFPAIRLHYLALNKDFQGIKCKDLKYSDILMGYLFKYIAIISELSGATFIFLESTENAVEFYKNYDFISIQNKQVSGYENMIFRISGLSANT